MSSCPPVLLSSCLPVLLHVLRNRALEDLARRTFPREAESAARTSRGRERGRAAPAAARGGRRGGRRPRQQQPVDQAVDFRYLRAPQDPRVFLSAPGPEEAPGLTNSSDEDGGYDLTSEVFLENVDDEFMPNFPLSSDSRTSGVVSGGRYYQYYL